MRTRRLAGSILFLGLLSLAPAATSAALAEEAGATVSGRVLGLAGDEPDPSSWVALFAKERSPISGALRADGTFRFRGVPPGIWTLATEASPHRRASTTIVVRPGQARVRANLRLPPVRSVSGRLLDDHGRRVDGATILIWRDSRTTSVTTRTDGSFQLDLPDGSYLLHVEKPGWRRYGPRDLQVQGTALADLEIRMENIPGITLRGRLLNLPPGDRVSLSATEVQPGKSWIPARSSSKRSRFLACTRASGGSM